MMEADLDLDELIDFLEGELPADEAAELERVLLQSIPERREFLKLSELRDKIALADPMEMEKRVLQSERYQRDLTAKIMAPIRRAAVERLSQDPEALVKLDTPSALAMALLRS